MKFGVAVNWHRAAAVNLNPEGVGWEWDSVDKMFAKVVRIIFLLAAGTRPPLDVRFVVFSAN
jgi:hypothetical protein